MADEDWFASGAREVRFEPLFEEQLKALGVDPEWLDDAITGLDISLAKHPEIFPKAPGTPFSCARLVIYKDAPALRIWKRTSSHGNVSVGYGDVTGFTFPTRRNILIRSSRTKRLMAEFSQPATSEIRASGRI